MKLQFKHQDFQTAAVNAVVDLFAGQEHTRATFSVVEEAQTSYLNELGVGNVLRISDDALTDNMRAVQKRNLLPLTDSAPPASSAWRWRPAQGKPMSTPRPFLSSTGAMASPSSSWWYRPCRFGRACSNPFR